MRSKPSSLLRRIVLFLLLSSTLIAKESEDHRVLYANLAGIGIIAGWGTLFWDYGETAPHAKSEGWFGHGTKSGGADKLGHLYASYLAGSGLSHLYEGWGYRRDDAALYGSLSSFFLMNAMEVGDSLSKSLGFSYEDFILNTAGSLASYLFYTNPELSRKVDFRLEYIPRFDRTDIVTDYGRMKYLLAFKAEGFDFITSPLLRYGEFHVGYYTRNYNDGPTPLSERSLYVGIGVNLSKIAGDYGQNTASRVLNFYQLPYTYVPYTHSLER